MSLTVETLSPGLQVRAWRARRAKRTLVFFPGGLCRAERYDWLAALNAEGTSVMVVDAAAPGATLAHLGQALDHARKSAPKVYAGGHSAGAALVQDALDPAAGRAHPRLVFPEGYEPPTGLAGLAVLGCSLQPRPLGMVLAHRSENRLLYRPGDMPLLFLAGDHDRLATPELMERTRRRYAPPTALVVVKGGTHYGFAAGQEATDNPAADDPVGADVEVQRRRCVAYLAAWMGPRPLAPIGADEVSVEALGRGPA